MRTTIGLNLASFAARSLSSIKIEGDQMPNDWPKKPIRWIENRRLHVSIPFTWNLPEVFNDLCQRSFEYDDAIVGGPAVKLMPDFFDQIPGVIVGDHYPGVLQKMNPKATRTTIGCVRRCPYCAVKRLEPKFTELDDWPDLPEVVDNNLLASSTPHFDKVIDRLLKHDYAIFNSGLDTRLLTPYHAQRLAELNNPIVYLALDSMSYIDAWTDALFLLRSAKLPKKSIRTYALVGFNSDPGEAWERCEYIESFGVKAFPMFYRPLDALSKTDLTDDQKRLGWTDFERRKIMQWFYKHKKAVEYAG